MKIRSETVKSTDTGRAKPTNGVSYDEKPLILHTAGDTVQTMTLSLATTDLTEWHLTPGYSICVHRRKGMLHNLCIYHN